VENVADDREGMLVSLGSVIVHVLFLRHCDYLPLIQSRNDLDVFLPEPGQYIVQRNSLMAFTYTL